MWLTDVFIRYPCRFILIGYFLLTINFIIIRLESGPISFIQGDRDFLIYDDPKVKDWDKMRVAEDYLLSASEGSDNLKALRRTKVKKWSPIIVFFSKNGSNLLDKERLQDINEIQEFIKNIPEWKTLCYADDKKKSDDPEIDDTECHPMESMVTPINFLKYGGSYTKATESSPRRRKTLDEMDQEEIFSAFK
jgi:hypothetical protein